MLAPVAAAPAYSGPRAGATLTITIPAPTARTSSALRSPKYIPASAHSVAIQVVQVGGTSVSDAVQSTNVAPGTAPCSSVTNADYTCTISAQLPPKTDTIFITVWDANGATGNELASQIYSASVIAGQANQFGTPSAPIILDAQPGAVALAASGGETGTYPAFTASGPNAETYTVADADTHGSAFGSQPGIPSTTWTTGVTGTGGSVAVNAGTLTVTPPSSSSFAVAVDDPPAGTRNVNVTTTSPLSAGGTTAAVTSTSNLYPGRKIVIDPVTFSGTTDIEEHVTITSVSGSTIAFSPAVLNAHATGATIQAYSDNCTPGFAAFTVSVVLPLIAPVAENAIGVAEALVFNTAFAQQAGSLTSDTEAFNFARFDASDNFYIGDQENDTVHRAPYTKGTGFGAQTTYTGLPPASAQAGSVGFDVGTNGTVAVQNSVISPQLDYYAPGTSSSPGAFTTSLGSSNWYTITESGFSTVAVLENSASVTFGYAYEVFDSGTSANDEIVVTSGSGEQDISTLSNFNDDPTPGILTWNQGRQSLIYVSSKGAEASAVLEYPRNGTTGATLVSSPTIIGSTSGPPISVAASVDGTYVAVAYVSGSDFPAVALFHYSGASWSSVATSSALTTTPFRNFATMHFIPDGDLVLVHSGSNDTSTPYTNFYEYTTAGALQSGFTNPFNATSDVQSNFGICDSGANSNNCMFVTDFGVSS
jgi:hypothetical protein